MVVGLAMAHTALHLQAAFIVRSMFIAKPLFTPSTSWAGLNHSVSLAGARRS